jgi:hypothetical protein
LKGWRSCANLLFIFLQTFDLYTNEYFPANEFIRLLIKIHCLKFEIDNIIKKVNIARQLLHWGVGLQSEANPEQCETLSEK